MLYDMQLSAHLQRAAPRLGWFQRTPNGSRLCGTKKSGRGFGRPHKRKNRTKKHQRSLDVKGRPGARDVDVAEVKWVEPQLVGLYREKSNFHGEVKVVQNTSDPDGRLPECYKDARILLLGPEGRAGNHSVYKKSNVFTGSYWDALAILPGICPAGVIGIYGLGSGTVARIVNKLYPERKMLGFEIDPQVLEVSRQFMGLQEIEDLGKLECQVCDCLAMEEGSYDGAFAGLIVDLYLKDTLVDGLDNVKVWQRMKQQLAPGGKILANVGRGKRQILDAIRNVFQDQVLVTRVDANCLVIASTDIVAPPAWENVPQDLLQYTKTWSVLTQ